MLQLFVNLAIISSLTDQTDSLKSKSLVKSAHFKIQGHDRYTHYKNIIQKGDNRFAHQENLGV